jgi:mRNA interferase MazF
MINEFDKWNIDKQNINKFNKNRKYHAGDIWWCNLGQNIGYEQNGTGKGFERPVLVVKGFSKNVCLIVPLTTKIKDNKFYSLIGLVNSKIAFAILSQIRLIDTKRLINQIGFVNTNKLNKIKKAIWKLIR